VDPPSAGAGGSKNHARPPEDYDAFPAGAGKLQVAGFTLIELVITIVLVSILSGIAAMIILRGVTMYSDQDTRSDVHYQARLAVERITKELRSMQSCSTIAVSSNPTGSFSFVDSNSSGVNYNVSGGNLFRGADLLASGITSTQPFSFKNSLESNVMTCASTTPGLNIWYIDISVTDTQGSQSLPIRTRVHPRNF
jgi:prepilin-type N-terminal cleavage/methylation domain-containing protein